KTIEREKLANYETSGRVAIEAFRNCRRERQQHNNHNRAACNHMIRSPADNQGHYSQNTKRRATRFLTKGESGRGMLLRTATRHRSRQSGRSPVSRKAGGLCCVLMRLVEDESMTDRTDNNICGE